MPVTIDSGRYLRVKKTGGSTLPASGSGAKASDIIAAMTSPEEASKQAAQIRKEAALIETMRVEGADTLTARDQAVYEYLLEQARVDGIESGLHTLALEDVLSYLGIRDTERLWQSLERIAGTIVSYDVRDGGRRRAKAAMLSIALEEAEEGRSQVRYEVPALVQEIIRAGGSYTHLEIAAFPGFRSRYTARLYPRLALRAGYHDALRRPWTIEPLELARELGAVPRDATSMHYAAFRRDVLRPVLADLEANVFRFDVRMDEVRGTGRGRPVTEIVFHLTERTRHLAEVKAARLSDVDIDLARRDARVEPDLMPSPATLSRGVTLVSEHARVLRNRWRSAVATARANGDAEVDGIPARIIVERLERDGTDAAFAYWCHAVANAAGGGLPARAAPKRLPLRPVPKPAFLDRSVAPTAPQPAAPEAAPAQPEPQPHAEAEPDAETKKREALAVRWRASLISSAQDLQHRCDSKGPGGIGYAHMDAYWSHYLCDPELTCWSLMTDECMPEDVRAAGGLLAKGLRVLAGCTHPTRVKALRSIAASVEAWDMDAIRKKAGYAISKGCDTPDGKPVPVPRYDSAGSRYGTEPVTELHAEIGYFGLGGATGWSPDTELLEDAV